MGSYRRGYPGDGYFYTLCAVCGRKIRARDAVLITDKYNYLNGQVVCKNDADKTNPQDQVRAVRERQISNPKFLRSEGADRFGFASKPSEIYVPDTSDPTGRTSSAPRFLRVTDVSGAFVELQWLGPLDSGSETVITHKIERESPVGGGFSTLTTTASSTPYYKDTTVSASTQYNYRVSVVNAAGTSDPSNEASVTTSA